LLLLSVAAALIVATTSGAFIWLVIRRPVRKLVAGMQMISSGILEHRLDASSDDEFGLLAKTFNTMSSDLEQARKELTAWSNTLEQKVREKTAELEKAHRHIVRVEKMASLGNLASSVAHELNNPLEGILTFARLLIKRLKKSSLSPEELEVYCSELQLVADEAHRCGTIVKNLLVFARQGSVSLQVVSLSSIVDRCVLLMSHHARMRDVELIGKSFADDRAECDPNQIQQAVLALISNAVEAVASRSDRSCPGKVEVSVEPAPDPEMICIRVTDNGVGISEEVKAHIFEPFFTTQSEGKGVGLGLSIVYGIIQRHHGHIEVESQIGQGATFTIMLPRQQPKEPSRMTSQTSEAGNS
jgi:two-component system NtrC family sensor kinase